MEAKKALLSLESARRVDWRGEYGLPVDYEAYRRNLLEAAEMFEAGQVKEAA